MRVPTSTLSRQILLLQSYHESIKLLIWITFSRNTYLDAMFVLRLIIASSFLWFHFAGLIASPAETTPLAGETCSTTATAFDLMVEADVDRIISVVDEEVEARLATLDQSIVEYRLDASVRYIIRMYVESWRNGSERTLGRTTKYFPYFSERLLANGMPDALKHLSITESALRPFAFSHAGAGGLWQLMPGTARELGLQVDSIVDERMDLSMGTEAGLRYLQIQYERYGNWALAMAAYNSGPGRVNRAKRRSGSNNYWKLRKYLPRETSTYVPGFIAATYLGTFFRDHGLVPQEIDLDLQITEITTVYQELSLHRVAMVTGLRPEVVIELNPAYLAGYLPARQSGRPLCLPRRVMPAMRTYLNEWHSKGEEPALAWLSPRLNHGELNSSQYYRQLTTTPTSLDTTYQQLAQALNVAPHHLLVWSGHSPTDSLKTNDWWTYYQIKESLAFGDTSREIQPAVAQLWSPAIERLQPEKRKFRRFPERSVQPLSPAPPSGIKKLASDIWFWIIQ